MALGAAFSALLAVKNRNLNIDPVRSVGLIAPSGTGKSAFLFGIHEGLSDDFNRHSRSILMQNGVSDYTNARGGLVRHFDLCVRARDPSAGYNSIRPHHCILAQGLERAGVELVEHANIYKAPRFDYILRLRALDRNSRTLSLYTTDKMAVDPAFQTFLDDNAGRRARPAHYIKDAIDACVPAINVWMPF